MSIKSFKPIVVAASTAVATIFFTRKRIKRAKLKAVHSKLSDAKTNG